MSRADLLRAELEEVGADEFVRRRVFAEDMPLKLMRNLALTETVRPEDVWRESHYAASLTPRRRRALQMMAEGRQSKELALELGCSLAAAMDLARTVLTFYGARSRAHAVHIAHLKGDL